MKSKEICFIVFEDHSYFRVDDYHEAKFWEQNGKVTVIKLVRKIPSSKNRRIILEKQNYKCLHCNKDLAISFHIDHIHPLSEAMSYKNGWEKINEIENLQALCPRCNISKGSKMNE